MDKIIYAIIALILGFSATFTFAFFFAWYQNAHKLASYDLKALMDAGGLIVQNLLGALGLHGTLNTRIPFIDTITTFVKTRLPASNPSEDDKGLPPELRP